MRRTRGLWVSVIVVVLLAGAGLAGLLSGSLAPTLGLDLQGGVAVILTAPDGTGQDVMEQSLENIRRRVDAFGVGEPDIFLSGTTIEVQIPGAADSTLEERPADLYCLIGEEDANHGCADEEADAVAALEGIEVTSSPTEVCVVTEEGDEVDCFASRPEAGSAIAGFTVAPEAGAGTDQGSASPTASAGPAVPAESYCLTDAAGAQPVCADTQAEAQSILNGLTTEVRERNYCLAPSQPEPAPSGGPSVSPSPSGLDAYQALDLEEADPLPCEFASEAEAQEALDSIEVQHVTTRYCIVSSAGEDLGCYTSEVAAAQRQRETGQQRLLDVIGTTARLEERPTLQIVAPTDPAYTSLPVTCSTEDDQDSPECAAGAQDANEVVYFDTGGNKVRLGPVILTGANVNRASAVLSGGDQFDPVVQWRVTFEFDAEGADAFAEATTAAALAPPPQNQIAIVVDRLIVSNPVVQEPITGGTGEITGDFTEQDAKELATLLNAGSLPVELTRQSARNVSPTLGEESLRAGIVAGAAGLLLLLLYLLFYYRLLGVVAWFGMTIWAVLAIALVSVAGSQVGYALTLAGVAGLVISLGVTADSYIVFFERLKEELHGGKSPRTVVVPAFKRAFRTILAADAVTAIAAVVLYVTAVSSVRGFALTLLVATALDLFVVYFFKRPTVILLAMNPKLARMRGFGLSAATATDHAVEEAQS